MKRREFIMLLGGTAVAWSRVARAQQSPVIGFLHAGTFSESTIQMRGFEKGLAESGYIDSQTVKIEYRWAEGRYERLPALAEDLVQRKVSLIAANPSNAATAAKAATTTIPIVFTTGFDPVRLGLVETMNRPGGNATGVSQLNGELGTKRLGLLRQLVPGDSLIGLVTNPVNVGTRQDMDDMRRAAQEAGENILVIEASTSDELDKAFATLVEKKGAGLVVSADPFFFVRRTQIALLAARFAVPVIAELREYAHAGCLMSYGTNLFDYFRLAGTYAGRILRGAKPADLPVIRPTKFELTINLRTAKIIGVGIPPTLLALADEALE
jgi:putative ABC transport system substrate-binding protein